MTGGGEISSVKYSLSDFGSGGCLIGEMHELSDAQLLRDYAARGNENAFREIVNRHAALVYSSALRQVISPDLARDVAQSIFTDLARKAPALVETHTENSSLLGWLYRSTRFTALNLLRDDRRRLARERQAMQHFDSATETTPDWDQVQPVLDEAMADLSDEDRDALLLRFFKNHDFRAIGSTLGVSDDAAQKRVTRALERLRTHLTNRGVTTTALALSTALAANAVPLAPVGLAATLSTGALVGTTLATAATVAKAIAMTTIQKTAIAATIAILAGAGIYEARQAVQLREQNQSLQRQQMSLVGLNQQLQRECDDATNRLVDLLVENSRLKSNPHENELLKLRGTVTQLKMAQNDPSETAAKSWAKRAAQLKQHLDQTPGAKIPELKYLNDDQWLNAASGPLETDRDYRRAYASLRRMGENTFIIEMQKALSKYLQANNNQFPPDISQLNSYFESTPEDAMLQRYTVVPASSIPNMKFGGDWLITVKDPIDKENDTLWGLGEHGFGSSDYASSEQAKLGEILLPAFKAYQAANNGHNPQDPMNDLGPYITTPEQLAVLQKLAQMRDAAVATEKK